MTNIFQDKIVKYLTLFLSLAIIGMLAQSFLLTKKAQPLPDSQKSIVEELLRALPKVPAVALNPEDLSNLKVENLRPFELTSFPTKVGRSNPFEPYPLVEEIYSTSSATTSSSGFSTSTVIVEPTTTPTSATTSGP